ncbi:hypothetical protein [Pseudonocardia sp. GCM10023141]|uniref:hypothetical protein n=1 Tax=Pseudonocardia sp. GCM10023141 TaxID=3252653 RepID=UPI003610F0DF
MGAGFLVAAMGALVLDPDVGSAGILLIGASGCWACGLTRAVMRRRGATAAVPPERAAVAAEPVPVAERAAPGRPATAQA